MGFPTFQSIRTYRRTGDEFSATAPCTYVRSVSPQTPLYEKTAGFTAIFWGEKSSHVKFANYLTDGRNGFTESRFSEQQSRCAETWEIIRFRVKAHGTEKSIGVTCGQDIITAILSGFESKAFFTMQRSGCAEWRTGFAFSLSEFWRGFEHECTQ